ncbi:MAG: recombination protein RecR [Anaerolineales bacterium]|nr:recombination protein RecR [Anaerolineales bacterium]
MTLPKSVFRLIEQFQRLPGVGPKTASRLAYHLLRVPEEQARTLGEALLELRAQTRFCSVCFNITDAALDPCAVCRDERRDGSLLCVVEAPLDVLALERAQGFAGRYHVLHGAISPVEGIGPENLKIAELAARVRAGGVREVILATNPSMEGEATAMYIHRQLQGLPVKVTRLARGLPVGGDLEYADETTLSKALEGRSEM